MANNLGFDLLLTAWCSTGRPRGSLKDASYTKMRTVERMTAWRGLEW